MKTGRAAADGLGYGTRTTSGMAGAHWMEKQMRRAALTATGLMLMACGGAASDAQPASSSPEAGSSVCESVNPCMVVDTDAGEPGTQAAREVRVGDTFTIGVVAHDVAPAPGAGTFQFTLLYDPDVLEAEVPFPARSISERHWECGPPAASARLPEDHPFGDENEGTADAFLACIPPRLEGESLSGTVVLGGVRFTAIARGDSELVLHFPQLASHDRSGRLLIDCTPVALEPGECHNASVTVTE